MIELSAYDPSWPTRFAATARELRAALGEAASAIEHIGSTAIPAAAAKPTIDVAVRVRSYDLVLARANELAAIGFYRIRRQPKAHRVFVRDVDHVRIDIAHYFLASGWESCNQRLFRDWLLIHPDDRKRYLAAKSKAAASAETMGDYTERKSMVVREITNRARAARHLPPVTDLDS